MQRARHHPAGKREGAEPRDATHGAAPSPAEIVAGSSPTPAKRTWWLALLLLVGTVLAYLPVWHAGLIWGAGRRRPEI
jgi:hypothetical protein